MQFSKKLRHFSGFSLANSARSTFVVRAEFLYFLLRPTLQCASYFALLPVILVPVVGRLLTSYFSLPTGGVVHTRCDESRFSCLTRLQLFLRCLPYYFALCFWSVSQMSKVDSSLSSCNSCCWYSSTRGLRVCPVIISMLHPRMSATLFAAQFHELACSCLIVYSFPQIPGCWIAVLFRYTAFHSFVETRFVLRITLPTFRSPLSLSLEAI